jgi:hypothetical protein
VEEAVTRDVGEGEDHDLHDLMQLGAEIAGSATAAAAGLAVAGPMGALGGAVVGPAMTHLLQGGVDLVRRHLSRREKVRVGAVIDLAADYLAQAQAAGRCVREDGFFTTEREAKDRPAAAEVIEGVLQAAQREHEERKIPYLARLMAEIALRPDVDRAAANLYVRSAKSLSYRQLQLLALLVRPDAFPLPPGNYRTRGLSNNDPVVPVLDEIFDLLTRQYVQMPGDHALGIVDVAPSKIRVIATGAWLVELMQLDEMPLAELAALSDLLARSLTTDVVGPGDQPTA